MKKKYFGMGLLLLSLSIPLFASSSVTLDQALELARANNLSLTSSAIDVNAAKRDVQTSWNLFLPSVSLTLSNAGGGPVFNAATTLMGAASYTNRGLGVGLSVSMTLNPAVKAQMDTYQVGYQIQQVTYAQAKAEVEKNVTKLFYYLLMQDQNIKVQQANLELAQSQYDQVKVKYDQGFASELELLSAQLSVEKLKPGLEQAKNQYQANLLSLKAMLGLSLDEDLSLEGEVPTLAKQLEVAQLQDYLAKSYSITLLDLNLQQLKSSYASNKQQALTPSLSLSGSYDISLWNDSYTNTFSDSASYSIGLRIPLDGFIPDSRTQMGLEKLQNSMDKLLLQRQQALQQLEVSVRGQVQNLNMLSGQADLAQQNIELTQRLYAMNQAQYESGYVSLVDLESAQNNLLSAKQNLLGVQYQYVSSLIDLLYQLNLQHEYQAKELL
ncbi:MAG: TolC family protein [Sphaerochaeta sp.]|jgi:outer membrane protein TolC|uniref:TolC family protein n=1 Tax=Sphaerochaeta sp. TaxID=1972642 RepID=UPI003D09F078